LTNKTTVGALYPVGIRYETTMKGFNGTPHATKSKPKSNKTRVKPRPAGADNLKAGKSK
jgi:hypothetical protein